MLEVLYDIATKEVRAWNADMKVKDNLKPKEGQEVVILPIDPPTFESDWYKVDLDNQQIVGNPDWIDPDLPTEDDIRCEEILSHSPPVITMPEIWEVLRILGKRLGYDFEE